MLLFLDLETTGFDNKKDNILEISAVRYDEDKKEIVAKFDRVLNLPEGVEVSSMIEGLTGISTEMCRDEGISMSQAQEEFSEFIQPDDIITGHNISFDTGFLNQFGFMNFETYRHKEVDTFILSVLVLGQEEESHALEILSEKYGIVHENAHRAMSDVLANLDFYLILQKIYARNFSENFQKFLESFAKNNQEFHFEEKYFFDSVAKNKAEFSELKLPVIARSDSDEAISSPLDSARRPEQNNSQNELFLEKFSEQKNLFFESYNAQKYVFSLFESAKKLGKNISLFYPNKQKEEFYKLSTEISDIHFFDDPEQSICLQKFQKFLKKESFDKFEAIVATKIFRAQDMNQELFVRFMGEEWKPARTLQGKKRENLSSFSQKILPLSEAEYQENSDEIRVFFGGENLEDQLLVMQEEKRFSKHMLEDFSGKNDVEINEKLINILSTLSTALRKEKGENKYSIKIQWKDFAKMSCRQEAQENFETFLAEDFGNCSELQKSHILDWISFFDEPQGEEIKIIELYPDNALSIDTINPFFEESFLKMCSANESTFFFGKSFPKDFSGNVSLSFSGAKPELLENFSLISEDKNISDTVYCPEFPRDATPREISECILSHISSENIENSETTNLHTNWIVSLTSKKNISEVRELLRETCDKEGIKIFSHESGGRGKIKKMMEKFPKKIVIGNTKFLAGLDLNPKEFSALFVHKVQFDHPKQPLIQAQRKRFQNDFEQFSMPRAIGRLEQDVFQFSETPAGEKIQIFLGEGRIYDPSTFYSKFQKVFPEGTKFKSWKESL